MFTRQLAFVAGLLERRTGLPGRFIFPVAVGGVSLQMALLGMYWDIGMHIDNGRDSTVFTAPHVLIVLGLQGLVVAALVHGVLPGPRARGERSLGGGRLSLAPGALQTMVCGGVAILAFPLDGAWHSLFGEDVTLWGPTHLFMIGGGTLGTLGVWMLLRSGLELGAPRRRIRKAEIRLAGGLIIAASSFQAEFDFGVPQFQLLYQPVLIAFTAGVGLVCARSLLGPGGALRALGYYLVVRAVLAVVVGPGLDFTTPHFALYVAEALLVEAVAVRLWQRPLAFAVACGTGIGTVGLASEWGWSHVWMAHPWTASLLPEALVLALAAGIGGAVLGARMAQALAAPGEERAGLAPLPMPAVAIAAAAVVAALVVPLPRTGGDGTSASVVPSPAGAGKVHLAVTLEPPEAARGAAWFEVVSWQGHDRRRLTPLRALGAGRFETMSPVPAEGNWKSLLRLAHGSHLMALPVFLPPSPQSGRAGVPVAARSQELTSDTFQLQREATGGPAWLTTLAYALLAGMAGLWLGITAWGLRAGEADPRRRTRPRARGRLAAA